MSATALVVGLLAVALLGALALAVRNHRRVAAVVASAQAEVAAWQARLQQFEAGQRHFVDRFAHSIRTQLTIAVNHAELLVRSRDVAAGAQGQARSLADYLRHWADLCEGFLRLGDPAGAPDTSQHTAVHCHDLVVGAVQRTQSLALGSGVRIVVSLADTGTVPADLEVHGHQPLLAAMLESLLRNAVQASPRGAVVQLRVEVRAGAVVFSVHDQGAVLSPAQLAGGFDGFGSGRTSLRRVAEPVMGLAITRDIVLHHSGSIAVHNDAAGGAVFEVALPRWHGDPAAVVPPPLASTASPAPELP